MTMSVSEGAVLPVASPLPTAGELPVRPSSEVLLEGHVSAHSARHQARPDHATMLRRVRAQ